MEIKLAWSQLAKEDYWEYIAYLENNGSINDVLNFMQTAQITFTLLQCNNVPFIQKYEKEVYKIVVTNRISLYYKLEADNIYLLRFWNHNMDVQ